MPYKTHYNGKNFHNVFCGEENWTTSTDQKKDVDCKNCLRKMKKGKVK